MLNKVMLIGNLGRDPELRYTQSGTAVATLNVATSRKWKGQDGQMQEETEWHRVIVWQRLAEICNEYLGKGSKIYVEGRLQTRKWTDNNGNDRYTTEIVAQDIQFLSPRPGAGSGGFAPGNDPGLPEDPGGFGPGPSTGEDVPF